MRTEDLEKKLGLKSPILSVTRVKEEVSNGELTQCALKAILRAAEGNKICINQHNVPCYGAITGFGFVDGLPKTPGGYGNFISHGKGEGYPKGEKIKSCAKIAEEMLLGQPQNVMVGYKSVCIQPYDSDTKCDLVLISANPDQISALIHLFNFNRSEYDNVIAPMVSGCASIFRIPFGEIGKEKSRAIIGNVDIGSRKHFHQNTFIFVITSKDFQTMLKDADNCFFTTDNWEELKKRI